MLSTNPINATLRALSFLTRLPIGDGPFSDTDESYKPADDAWAYPLCGLIIAAPGAAIVALGSVGHTTLLACVIAIAVTAVLTGALHEDGLADTIDGFGGGQTQTRRLEIMKDSAIGTYGVLALMVSFALQVLSVADLTATGAATAAILFAASHAGSRAAMVMHWSQLPLVRSDGTAARAGTPNRSASARSLALCVGGYAIISVTLLGIGPSLISLCFGALAWLYVNRLCMRMIGGHTGDTIGFCQQVIHCTMLCSLAFSV